MRVNAQRNKLQEMFAYGNERVNNTCQEGVQGRRDGRIASQVVRNKGNSRRLPENKTAQSFCAIKGLRKSDEYTTFKNEDIHRMQTECWQEKESKEAHKQCYRRGSLRGKVMTPIEAQVT